MPESDCQNRKGAKYDGGPLNFGPRRSMTESATTERVPEPAQTDESPDAVRVYLRSIGQHALLDSRQEVEYALGVEE